MTRELQPPATRPIFAGTRERILHGKRELARDDPATAKVLGKDVRGVVASFAEVELDVALAAYDEAGAACGTFALITAGQTRIDFLFGRKLPAFLARLFRIRPRSSAVTLDLWFEESPDPPLEDVVAVDAEDARELIVRAYRAQTDTEIWMFVRDCLAKR